MNYALKRLEETLKSLTKEIEIRIIFREEEFKEKEEIKLQIEELKQRKKEVEEAITKIGSD